MLAKLTFLKRYIEHEKRKGENLVFNILENSMLTTWSCGRGLILENGGMTNELLTQRGNGKGSLRKTG